MQTPTGLCDIDGLRQPWPLSFRWNLSFPNWGTYPWNLRSLQLKENAIIIIIITLKCVEFPGSDDLHNLVALHFREDKEEKDTPLSLAPTHPLETPLRSSLLLYSIKHHNNEELLPVLIHGTHAVVVGLSQICEVNSSLEGAFMWFFSHRHHKVPPFH